MFYHSWAEAIHRSCIVGPLAITDQGASDLSYRKPDLITNADGSVDVFIGPTEPEGKKNWIETALGKGWFAYFAFMHQRKVISTRPGRCPILRK
jgi:hypothetical protein